MSLRLSTLTLICFGMLNVIKCNNVDVMDCLNVTDSVLKCLLKNIENRNVSKELIDEVNVLGEKFNNVIENTNYVTNIGDAFVNMSKIDGDNVIIRIENRNITGRKMKMKMQNFLPFLIAPAFLLAGIMPWIIPKIKLAVFLVVLMNNFVFWQALFALVRNYVFNKVKDEHIIYLNHGYKNKEIHVHHPPKMYNHHRMI